MFLDLRRSVSVALFRSPSHKFGTISFILASIPRNELSGSERPPLDGESTGQMKLCNDG